jgi:hypothetical protein
LGPQACEEPRIDVGRRGRVVPGKKNLVLQPKLREERLERYRLEPEVGFLRVVDFVVHVVRIEILDRGHDAMIGSCLVQVQIPEGAVLLIPEKPDQETSPERQHGVGDVKITCGDRSQMGVKSGFTDEADEFVREPDTVSPRRRDDGLELSGKLPRTALTDRPFAMSRGLSEPSERAVEYVR